MTGGQDDKAYVWDAKTGEVVLECTDHKDSVIFANFSYDDAYVASGDMNGNIQVRKTSDKSVVWSYSMGDATVSTSKILLKYSLKKNFLYF